MTENTSPLARVAGTLLAACLAALAFAAPASALPGPLSKPAPPAKVGSLVVGYKPGFPMILAADRVGSGASNLVLGAASGSNVWKVSFRSPVTRAAALQVAAQLASSPAVAFAEPDLRVGTQSPGSTPAADVVRGLVVGYKPGYSMVLGADWVSGAQAGNLVVLTGSSLGENMWRVDFKSPVDSATALKVAAELASSPAVKFAEPDRFVSTPTRPAAQPVSSLVVGYEPGFAQNPKSKIVLGSDKVTGSQRYNLLPGPALGENMWRVDFKSPVDSATALKVAAELASSPTVKFAEPDRKVAATR